jgi:hypothetical protein
MTDIFVNSSSGYCIIHRNANLLCNCRVSQFSCQCCQLQNDQVVLVICKGMTGCFIFHLPDLCVNS